MVSGSRIPTQAAPDSRIANAETLADLEFPALLAVVATFAATDLGRGRTLALEPLADETSWHRRRRQLLDAGHLLLEGRLVPPWEEPVEPLLAAVRTAPEDLSGRDLLELARLAGWAVETVERLRAEAAHAPATSELAPPLPRLEDLASRVSRVLDPRGNVRDDASPRLTQLRRRVRRLRDGLYGELERELQAAGERYSEPTVTVHEGRLVLLLQAGARGRTEGLVHGRSGSGRSFYFEPLSAVHSNNRFREASAAEEEERRRILRELVDAAGEAQPEWEAAGELMGTLDMLQAACLYGDRVQGRQAELAPPGELALVAARHPLLDPRLASARHEALGRAGHDEELVPLDLELTPERRLLVITGPNAGGKTVALKTLGALVLAHQAGLPVPAAAGTRLPLFRRVVAQVGDEQDVLADRSTFSGRLLRLREAWEAAGPGSLILLDELGSGTDPEEGGALAQALLEELLDRGAYGLVTTHLVRLALEALDRDGAACAAMGFDSASGRPLYRLELGSPGGSEALALARRLGLPERWLERAAGRVDPGAASLAETLRRVESERQRAADAANVMEREREELRSEREALTAERAALGDERRRLTSRLERELDAFRATVRRRLEEELERWRTETPGRKKGRASATAGRLMEGAPRLELDPEPAGELALGTTVRHRRLGWQGVLESVDGERATVLAGGKRLRLAVGELTAATGAGRQFGAPAAVRTPEAGEVDGELRLLGRTVEEALAELEGYLDRAARSGRDAVRIVHGHGSGRLKRAVRDHLARHPLVAGWRPGDRGEGGDGATVVTLSE
ncbi:MAG: endonuclease MutS2 [Thermoanaerobaculia bacterium]